MLIDSLFIPPRNKNNLVGARFCTLVLTYAAFLNILPKNTIIDTLYEFEFVFLCLFYSSLDSKAFFLEGEVFLCFAFLVDGGFSLWSTWTTCSQTCGTGTKSRTRTCDNPVPNYNGQNCTGNFSQAISCKIESCPGKRSDRLVISLEILGYLLKPTCWQMYNQLRNELTLSILQPLGKRNISLRFSIVVVYLL